jgi:hypothetical protein
MGEYHQEMQVKGDTRAQVAALWELPREQIEAYVVIGLRHRPDGDHSFAWATNLPDDAAAGMMLAAIENHASALIHQQIADMVPDDASAIDGIV